MNVVVFLNVCALLFYAAALAVIAVAVMQKRIHRSVGIFAAICMSMSFFVCVSNIFEHLAVSSDLDDYEGFARDLFALFLLLFLYLDSIHREFDRRAANELQIRADLEEKTTLLKEIHHRVKNNLQIVSSLLSLQGEAKRGEPLSEDIINAKNRILSIAAVHDIIYSSNRITSLDAQVFLDTIISNLVAACEPGMRNIGISRSIESGISFDVDSAIPAGLIVNELITNSLKHAFTGRESGEINVALRRSGGFVELRVADNGNGMNAGAPGGEAAGIGMQLVSGLVMQIRGEMMIDTSQGTAVSILFPGVRETDSPGPAGPAHE